MRNILLSVVFIFLIATLPACSINSNAEHSETFNQTDEHTATVCITSPEQENIIESFSTTPPVGTNIQSRTVYHETQGKLSPGSATDNVAVYATNIDNGEIFADTFLEATVQGKTLTYELGKWEYRVFREGGISVADLDGDGVDEIVLIMTVTGNGGALSQVFSANGGKIQLLYDLNDIPLNLEIAFKDSFLMTIENSDVGFMEEIDISNKFASEKFNESGKFIKESPVYWRPIFSGFVDLSSSHKTPVIICNRLIFLDLGSRLGVLSITLQYDHETGNLAVVSLALQEC